jgi:putative spermidine/putrescine transport system ATP-binding protein
MSDRIVVFDDGAVQQLATPEVLYEKPENSFVAQFIGENNRLNGTIKAVNGDTCTVEVDGGAVEALAVNIEGAGAGTLLSLRPESVLIDPPAGSCPNNFNAQVEELIYLGDHTRVRVNVCGTNEFVIKVPRSAAAPDLAVGRTMNIGWQSKECRALDPM